MFEGGSGRLFALSWLDMKQVLGVLFVVVFAVTAGAQTQNKDLIEKVDVHFLMPADPTPESVGFDKPKSYWKLKYELMLSDSFELEKMGRCIREAPAYRFNCPIERSGKMRKKMRKTAIEIAKGEFIKRGPMTEADREVVVPVQLTPEIREMYNKSVGVDSVNPTLLLFVKTRVSTKAADGAKFKGKMTTEGIHALKIYTVDMRFDDYWNITRIGLSLGLSRGNDGKIRGFHIYRF